MKPAHIKNSADTSIAEALEIFFEGNNNTEFSIGFQKIAAALTKQGSSVEAVFATYFSGDIAKYNRLMAIAEPLSENSETPHEVARFTEYLKNRYDIPQVPENSGTLYMPLGFRI